METRIHNVLCYVTSAIPRFGLIGYWRGHILCSAVTTVGVAEVNVVVTANGSLGRTDGRAKRGLNRIFYMVYPYTAIQARVDVSILPRIDRSSGSAERHTVKFSWQNYR